MIGFCGGTLIKTVDQVFLTDCGEAHTFCLESKKISQRILQRFMIPDDPWLWKKYVRQSLEWLPKKILISFYCPEETTYLDVYIFLLQFGKVGQFLRLHEKRAFHRALKYYNTRQTWVRKLNLMFCTLLKAMESSTSPNCTTRKWDIAILLNWWFLGYPVLFCLNHYSWSLKNYFNNVWSLKKERKLHYRTLTLTLFDFWFSFVSVTILSGTGWLGFWNSSPLSRGPFYSYSIEKVW